MQPTSCQQIIRAHRHCGAIDFAVFAIRNDFSGFIHFFPCSRNIKVVLFQKIFTIPHSFCIQIQRNTIAVSVFGRHFSQRISHESVATDLINQVVDRSNRLCINHFNKLRSNSAADVRNIAGCKAGRPLGVEVRP